MVLREILGQRAIWRLAIGDWRLAIWSEIANFEPISLVAPHP